MADSASDGMETGGCTAQAPCGRKRRGLTRNVVPACQACGVQTVIWGFGGHKASTKTPNKPIQPPAGPAQRLTCGRKRLD